MTLIHNGTSTSIAAAESVQGSAAIDRERILDAVRASGMGLTRDEISERTGINPNTVRPRCVELIANGRLEELGEIRRTASGRAARVLTAVTL